MSGNLSKMYHFSYARDGRWSIRGGEGSRGCTFLPDTTLDLFLLQIFPKHFMDSLDGYRFLCRCTPSWSWSWAADAKYSALPLSPVGNRVRRQLFSSRCNEKRKEWVLSSGDAAKNVRHPSCRRNDLLGEEEPGTLSSHCRKRAGSRTGFGKNFNV